jgi:hypothetical protein
MNPPLRTYHLHAHILCHDVRLSWHLDLDVELDHQPDIPEAEVLLQPAAEELLLTMDGKGCPYELDEFKITRK